MEREAEEGRSVRWGGGEEELRDLVALRTGAVRRPAPPRIVTDTTQFFLVDYGDVALLGGRPYLIRNNEREGRFGMDDQPKFWVKRAIDLLSGETKIIKLDFREKFESRVGQLLFECIRSPLKEARVLDLVRGHPRFMQGFSVDDEAGNRVRIIEYIPGRTLAERILTLGSGHEEYHSTHLPGLLATYVDLAGAVAFLHDHGEKHGDIRRDHVLVSSRDGGCRWIDFDFNFHFADNPYQYDLFGLGNLLVYLVGRGDVTVQGLKRDGDCRAGLLEDEDMNVVFRNRVVNLRKIYPYISASLNRILMHFAAGAECYYETAGELLEDLGEAAASMNAEVSEAEILTEKEVH